MTFADRDVEVVVIGGGPVGLSMALQLGRAGIETLLVERRATVSTHPKAFGIHGRTMEIFRQWAVADDVRRSGIPPERTQGVGWFTRLNGDELGRIMFVGDDAVEVDPGPGPEPPCFCPQPAYERVLLDAVLREPHVAVAFDCEARDIEQSDDCVEVTVRPDERIGARYVVAADGIASSARTILGIEESGTPAFGHTVNVYFRADLERYAHDKPFALLWIVNADTQGTLAPASADFTMWTYNFATEPGVVYGTDELVDRVRQAVGDPQLEVVVHDVLRWDYDQAVTDHWRAGRVFLVGDAAHRFPPHGGFGMNSGVQDAQNLAWKLVEVLRGRAGDALLDTYEAERKPVAEYNGRQALHNTHSLQNAGLRMPDLDELREHFRSEGQQFGAVYQSDAVVDDGTVAEVSTVTDYRPTGHPGPHAPHLWLTGASGEVISTVDLWDGGFVLLTNDAGDHWNAAASAVGVSVHRIGPDAGVYGISVGGAVLVRPDGHVGARFADLPEDPRAQLALALGHILQTTARITSNG